MFESTPADVSIATTEQIHKQIDDLEKMNPNATIIALGDLNHVNIKLPKYYQQVNCPTRGNKTLDKCYIKQKACYKSYRLPQLGNSDHNSVLLLPKYKPVSRSGDGPTKAMLRDWSHDNTEKLVCALETTDWESLTDGLTNANDQTEILMDYLSFCLDDCVPAVERVFHHDKPWVNVKIRKLLAARHFALSHDNKSALVSLKPKLQSEIRKAKHFHARKVEKSFNTSDRSSWKRLKSMLKLKGQDKECSLDPNTLNEFYTRFERDFVPPNLPPLLSDDIPSVNVDEVITALRKVKCNKSPGPDCIPGRLLKVGAYALGQPLCKLFNHIIAQGQFPSVWKLSNIKPIPKSNSAVEVKDYRPVALTSIVAKTFERLLLRFVKSGLCDKHQFAYQSQRSTEDAVAYLIDIVSAHLDADAKNYVRSLFIDFTSAFNTIDPRILIDGLVGAQLHSNIVNTIYSFLTDRTQRVVTNSGMSSLLPTSIGSPQGCVLSPVLFTMYVQHMPSPSATNYHLLKYADDTVLIELLHSDELSSMQQASELMIKWCTDNELVINVGKTKEMFFSNLRFNPVCDDLFLNDSKVDRVANFTSQAVNCI